MADMKIETTIGDLVIAEPALAKLAAVKLDAKTRYHVMKLSKQVAAETKEHFYEPRQQAFKDFAVERDPTSAELRQMGPEKVLDVALASPEKRAAFAERVKDLQAVAVTISWGPVTSTMLENYPEFTASDCLALGPLFELVEPTEVKT